MSISPLSLSVSKKISNPTTRNYCDIFENCLVKKQPKESLASSCDVIEYIDDALERHKDVIGDYIDKKIDMNADKIHKMHLKRIEEIKKSQNIAKTLPMDAAGQSSRDNDEQKLPHTARLWTNLVVRDLLMIPLSFVAMRHDHDNMTTGETWVASMMWLSEDIPALIKRHKQVRNGEYKNYELDKPKYQRNNLKNFNDYALYGAERVGRFWQKYGMTDGAIRTTLPFVAYDAVVYPDIFKKK